jgi:hypothetical protein
MNAESGVLMESALLHVVAVSRLVSTFTPMERNVATHVSTATEIRSKGNATLMSFARSIARGSGVTLLLVPELVIREPNGDSFLSPRRPLMAAKFVLRQVVTRRSMLAVPKLARSIAWAIGRTGPCAPILTIHLSVVIRVPRIEVTLSMLITPKEDANARQKSSVRTERRLAMHQQLTPEAVTCLVAQKIAKAPGASLGNAQARTSEC